MRVSHGSLFRFALLSRPCSQDHKTLFRIVTRGGAETYVGDAENIVGVPDGGLVALGDGDEVGHAGHEGPAHEGSEGPLHPPLAALVCIPQPVDDGSILGLEVGLDARRNVIVVGRRAQQRVGQREGDEPSDGQDEEGEELALLEGSKRDVSGVRIERGGRNSSTVCLAAAQTDSPVHRTSSRNSWCLSGALSPSRDGERGEAVERWWSGRSGQTEETAGKRLCWDRNDRQEQQGERGSEGNGRATRGACSAQRVVGLAIYAYNGVSRYRPWNCKYKLSPRFGASRASTGACHWSAVGFSVLPPPTSGRHRVLMPEVDYVIRQWRPGSAYSVLGS